MHAMMMVGVASGRVWCGGFACVETSRCVDVTPT
jgi:hypothetical protein